MRLESVIDEDAVAGFARTTLQGQSDEVAEAAVGHGILIGEEAIIGLEAEVGGAFHGFGQDVRSQPAGQCCRDRLGEEDPDMAAVAGAGAFHRRRHALDPACLQEGGDVLTPGCLVEVGRQKPAGLVRKNGIDAHGEVLAIGSPATQMPGDHVVGHRQEAPIGAVAALDLGLVAQARLPLVGAGRCISRLAAPRIVPALREDILAAPEQRTEQGDLGGGRRRCGHQPVNGLFIRSGPAIHPDSEESGQPAFQHRPLALDRGEAVPNHGDLVVRYVTHESGDNRGFLSRQARPASTR